MAGAKYTYAQREIIRKIIWDLDRAGKSNKDIENKLEEVGYPLKIKQIDNYKAGLANEIANANKSLITFDTMQLEQDIRDKIADCYKARMEAKDYDEKIHWHNELIDARSRLVLLRDGIIEGIEVNDGSLHADDKTPKRKETSKEFAQFIERTTTE